MASAFLLVSEAKTTKDEFLHELIGSFPTIHRNSSVPSGFRQRERQGVWFLRSGGSPQPINQITH